MLSKSILALIFFVPAAGAQVAKPYSLTDVLQFVQGGVSTTGVLTRVKDRCIDFKLTSGVESVIRNSGGEPALIAGLALACNKSASLPVSPVPTVVRREITKHDTVATTIVVHDTVRVYQPTQDSHASSGTDPLSPLDSALVLIRLDKSDEAATILRPIVESEPKNLSARLLLIRTMSNAEEISAELHAAKLHGAEPSVLAQIALERSTKFFNGGETGVRDVVHYQQALAFSQLSDTFAPTPEAKYVAGISAYLVANDAMNNARKTKSCALATAARDNYAIAQELLPLAPSKFADETGRLLATAGNNAPFAQRMVKQFCR